MVELLSTAPAVRFGLAENASRSHADIVLFDPDAERTISADALPPHQRLHAL